MSVAGKTFGPDFEVEFPPNAKGVSIWAKISATDEFGVTINNIEKGSIIKIDTIQGVCSFSDESFGKKLRSIVGIVGGVLTGGVSLINPDYSWNMLIRASNPAFSCGRSPVSLEALSIRLNRLENRTIEPVINRFPARGTVTRRQVDFPARNPHRFGPFHGPVFSSVHYPGAQDTRASLCHNRFQSVAP